MVTSTPFNCSFVMQLTIRFLAVLFCTISISSAADVPGIVAKAPEGVRSVKVEAGYMVPYQIKMSDEVTLEMIPIPGGKFKLGSPANEAGRKAHDTKIGDVEGPQVEVEIAPFWMGKTEVTWAQYKEYLKYEKHFKIPLNKELAIEKTDKNAADAVSAPSNLYEPTYTFEHGEDPELPAVTMSQFAARQFTKWISKRTNLIYRLPNEAEWEYACRAGTTTAYSFGDDVKQLDEYAWHAGNSEEKPHHVAQKKPNPWGLYDMHGNAMEWTLDAYNKDGDAYKHLVGKQLVGIAATNWPKELFPRVLRGGSFEYDANRARSAAREASDDYKWYDTDPNTPKSPWWLTDDPARAVGMRIIRPLIAPTAEELKKCWEVDNEITENGLKVRLEQGRGSLGVTKPE
jgi:formylglycine-generating enzyme